MLKYLKRQWLRFKQSCLAFKREWQYNYTDSTDHVKRSGEYVIMGLGKLREYYREPEDTFDLKPPYYGQALQRVNGHVFTLKYKHYNEETGVVRYLETNKPESGFVVVTPEYLDKDLNK